MDREVMHIRDSLMPRYADLVYDGYWFSPEREMLQTLIDDSQKTVNGMARVKLYKGHCRVVGRKSDDRLASSTSTLPPSKGPGLQPGRRRRASSSSTPCACASPPSSAKI